MDLKLKNNDGLSLFNKTEGYIPLPYVQTVGNVNIQLASSIDYSKTFVVETVFEPISINEANCVLYGPYSDTTLQSTGCRAIFETSGSTTLNIRTATSGNVVAAISGTTTIYHAKNNVKINNVNKSIGSYSCSGTYSFRILNGNMSVKIVSIKVTHDGAVIRNLVPAISPQLGHAGEYCLYDKQNNTYYYASSTGSFISDHNISQHITTVYIKDCPMIDGIDILKYCPNLTRVRLDIGNVSGSIEELQHYTTLSGYSDNYEEQIKPRIIGTFTVNSYYTTAELEALDGLIDGLTIIPDTNYNIDYLVSNGQFAIQTFDENADNYNPAVAIILNNNNIGHVHGNNITVNGGRYYLEKSDAAQITSIPFTYFRDTTSVVDTEAIVSNNDALDYDFETFDELKYFTGISSLADGSNNNRATFQGCSNLESIELPEGLQTIGIYSFYSCSKLSRIVLPSTLIKAKSQAFVNNTAMNGGSVYYNGTLEQWMNITFDSTIQGREANPTYAGAHLYLQGEELTSLTIPTSVTKIGNQQFTGCKYITGSLVIPNNITSIGFEAFKNCTGLTGTLTIPSSVTSIGQYAFDGCSGLTGDLVIPNSVTTLDSYFIAHCTNLTNVTINKSITIQTVASGTGSPSDTNKNGNGTGTLFIRGNVTGSFTNFVRCDFKNIIITGDETCSTRHFQNTNQIVKTFRVGGNCNHTGTASTYNFLSSVPKFAECMGTASVGGTTCRYFGNYTTGGIVLHLGNNAVVVATPANVNASGFTNILVGDGSSRANDEAVLALYLADTNWSAQSAKLGTWYDYNGEYKWYYITDNLTNCTNTNPDEWPHITRGESYETTIVPDEGMTIDSLTVEMLDTDTTSPTYDTYVPQPTSYDSATGIYTISIPSVTGNVVITASAS